MKSSTKVINSSLFPWKRLSLPWMEDTLKKAHLGCAAPPQDSHHDLLQRAPVFAISMLGRNRGLVITLKKFNYCRIHYNSKKNLPIKMNLSKWNGFVFKIRNYSAGSTWRLEAASPEDSLDAKIAQWKPYHREHLQCVPLPQFQISKSMNPRT